jgi:flagellar biosynthesis protein FlhG
MIPPVKGYRKMDKAPMQIIGIASGKGGVGKTTISANLAVALAARGKSVMLFDADLGLANAQLALGCKAPFNFSHVITGEKTLKEIIVEGPKGVKLVPGSSGIQHLAALNSTEAAGIIHSFSELEDGLDYFIVDMAAGLSDSVMTFLSACQHRFIVLKNEPSSIADAYATIKVMIQNYELDNIYVLPNSVPSQREGQNLYKRINSVIKSFLGSEVGYLYSITEDEMLLRAIRSSQPSLSFSPASAAARDFSSMADAVEALPENNSITGGLQFFVERMADSQAAVD